MLCCYHTTTYSRLDEPFFKHRARPERPGSVFEIKVRIIQEFISSRTTILVHVQGRDLSRVRLIQSESENSLRNRISSDFRKTNPAGHFSFMKNRIHE